MIVAKGSSHNHQAWEGGYPDHILQCLCLAEKMYRVLGEMSPLPFTLESACVVLYFHDIEKIWKYSTGLPVGFDKTKWYTVILPQRYAVDFTEDEINALQYIHGADSSYRKDQRVLGPLAAFCHVVDTISARVFHDKKIGDLNGITDCSAW